MTELSCIRRASHSASRAEQSSRGADLQIDARRRHFHPLTTQTSDFASTDITLLIAALTSLDYRCQRRALAPTCLPYMLHHARFPLRGMLISITQQQSRAAASSKKQQIAAAVVGPVLVRVGVRDRVRVTGWVGSTTPVPLSDQEVLSARKREQPTAPKIRAVNLLGELPFRSTAVVNRPNKNIIWENSKQFFSHFQFRFYFLELDCRKTERWHAVIGQDRYKLISLSASTPRWVIAVAQHTQPPA